MATPIKSLFSDKARYEKAFEMFKERTNSYQRMNDFIDNQLPDIIKSIVKEKSQLNVIGVGSGAGEFDVRMLSMIQQKYPQVKVDSEMVDPNPQQLSDYKDLVSKTPGLESIKFDWNEMTAEEFEAQWKENKMMKKADLINMFQMQYFMKDTGATVIFLQSLLGMNGKLLMTAIPGKSGWGKLMKTYGDIFCESTLHYLNSDKICAHLSSKGLSYQIHELPCPFDITECFTEGDETGEVLVDFLTEVLHFSKTVAPELKAEFLKFLRKECCEESSGRVVLNHDFDIIVVDQLN